MGGVDLGSPRGFIDWATLQANQARIGANTRPVAHAAGRRGPGGHRAAARDRGLRRLRPQARRVLPGPAKSTPGYYCTGTGQLVEGRGVRHLRVGGVGIDAAVAGAFLAALAPAGAAGLPGRRRAARDRPRRRARTVAPRGRAGPLPGRQGRATLPRRRPGQPARRPRPGNRLGERAAQPSPTPRPNSPAAKQQRPKTLTPQEKPRSSPSATTSPRVVRGHHHRPRPQATAPHPARGGHHPRRPRPAKRAELTLRWRGGAITELAVAAAPQAPPKIRTDEDTIDTGAPAGRPLPRRGHRRDPQPARPHAPPADRRSPPRSCPACAPTGRSPATSPAPSPPTASWSPSPKPPRELGVAPSTLHRWLNDGFIAGEQTTPGAPWRIRLTDELRALFVEHAPDGYLPMLEATHALGVSRQTVLQRVKRGELEAVHVRAGRRKGLRIRVPAPRRRTVLTTTSDQGAV